MFMGCVFAMHCIALGLSNVKLTLPASSDIQAIANNIILPVQSMYSACLIHVGFRALSSKIHSGFTVS